MPALMRLLGILGGIVVLASVITAGAALSKRRAMRGNSHASPFI